MGERRERGAARARWDSESRVGYPQITEVAPSPDGRQVLYAVREPLLTDDRSEFITHLLLASRGGGGPIPLTFGHASAGGARWSPDGQYIAFLSNRSGRGNIWVMRAAGGEAWTLTAYDKTEVSALAWAPDGGRLAFLMADAPSEEEERRRRAKDDAIRWDEDFAFAHLHVVSFAVAPRALPEATRLTGGRFHVVGFDWLPDGRALAIVHQPTPVHNTWTEARLATVPVEGGAPVEIGRVANNYGARSPIASPDGRWIACYTGSEPIHWDWGFAGRITLYPVGGGAPRPLALTPEAQTDLIGWSADGSELYVFDWRGVATQLLALPVSGEAPRPLTDAALVKTLPAVNRRGQIAFVGQSFHEPNAVYLLDLVAGASAPEWVAQPPLPPEWPTVPLPRVEVIRWPAPDGQEVEGILTYPLDEGGGGPYPTIVEVHGGPAWLHFGGYLAGTGGHADLPTLAERGYAVLRPNPRGSRGYGPVFRAANRADWGGGDYRDIMAGVDALVARGVADPDRLGILGWSYGGFMTSWAVTQTDRFKAACVGAGITDPVSFNGTTDIPDFIPDTFGVDFWDDLAPYVRQSPILHAAKARTPTLIQHGEHDPRVPVTQGKEFYNALKRRGVPAEMVIYPRQGHVITEPRLLLAMKRHATAWLDRWLRGEPPPAGGGP